MFMDQTQSPYSNERNHFFHFFSSIIKTKVSYAILFFLLLVSTFLVIFVAKSFETTLIFRFDFLSQIQKNNDRESSQGSCNYYVGRWVRDEIYKTQFYDEDCPFLDPGFRCHQSGRKDVDYMNWRWQPHDCDIPRFNASALMEKTKNGRIIFAGDSIGRNQWESFLCMLAKGVANKSTIYEQYGNPITKHKGFLSMRFTQYNLTVEYYRVPFLVIIGRPPPNSSAEIKMAIKVDRLHWFSKKWVGADVLVFNAGHWWNEDKTIKMGYHFEEGGKVNISMNTMEAFQRSLQTWKSWATQNLNLDTSRVFFRGYSPVHYRNGLWNDGGRCDVDMQPETNYTMLDPEPINNHFISNVVKEMENEKMKVQYLNITYLSQFRYDGHPSLHREPGTPLDAPQDCSHWCLPGVPDVWNEILYAHLLSMGFRRK